MSGKNIPYESLYEKAFLVRSFESRLLELFSEGKLFGTTHTYVGQEANAVSCIPHLSESDIVFSNHRCHGHYLVKENDPKGLMAEVMGRVGGVCGGRGGSQHLCKNNFYSNGIQGGFLPNVLGMAFAEKYKRSNNIAVAFIGDGTLGEGVVYETLNLASLWHVPLLIVVENNRYAQTTPIENNLAGSVVDRIKAFGLPVGEIESNDVSVLYPLFEEVIGIVRENKSPYVQVVHTYRLNAHSKGDDFRDNQEIDLWRKKDPLGYMRNFLDSNKIESIENSVVSRLRQVEAEVSEMAFSVL